MSFLKNLVGFVVIATITSGLYAGSATVLIQPDVQAAVLSVAQQLNALNVPPPPAMQSVFALIAANKLEIPRALAYLAIDEYKKLVQQNPKLNLASFDAWAAEIQAKRANAKK